MQYKIPGDVSRVTTKLKKSGFEAYLIGGCVRDLLLGREPKDWDVATNANPEQILKIFPDSFYENSYGTVGVKNENVSHETLKIVEVTPYRLESKYSDKRHPDSVIFSDKIEDDLQRRDFTINSIALDPDTEEIIDPFKGQKDLEEMVIRTVGNPDDRFQEDGLRIMRAIRLQSELGFVIEDETSQSIQRNANLLKHISWERIRDEFVKIIMSENPAQALMLSHKLGILAHIIPEIEEGVGIEQGGSHKFDVWEHNLRTLQHASDKNLPFHVRLAALLHDVAKPKTRKQGQKKEWTFYGHEVIGEKMAKQSLERLKFSRETLDKVTTLIRWHMFFADPEAISKTAIRRLISHVGQDMIKDLINLRMCDRIGMGRPKEEPYRLRKYQAMIEEVLSDPVSVGMLKIDGDILIKELHMKPGPRIGWILHALLEEVLEDPNKNKKEYLLKRSEELDKLSDQDLEKLGEKGREEKLKKEEKKIKEINKKYSVN